MHRHAFFRTARTTQAALTCGADIEHLADLARTYWAILSRPTLIEGRADFLACDLDTNGDGRIRMPEVLEAIEWLKPRIASFDRLFLPYEGLVKEDFRDDTPEGKALSDLLAQIAPDGKPVSKEALWEKREERLGCEPTVPGKFPHLFGLGSGPLFEMADAFWCICPDTGGDEELSRQDFENACRIIDSTLAWITACPKGDWTYEDARDLAALCDPIEDYFVACETLRYDPTATPLTRDPAKPLEEAPLALPSADSVGLPLRNGVNPSWKARLKRVAKWIGKDVLTPDDWKALCDRFAPLMAWYYDETETCTLREREQFFHFVDLDDEERIALLTNGDLRNELKQLITEEESKIPIRIAFDELQRFAALREGLLRFLRNFVNVSDLYPPVADPLFLCGKLFMDGRIASLCFPVENGGEKAHAALAAPARCCLVYCTLERKDNSPRTILAVFTAGTVGALTVGKRGLFVDLNGNDWEATISHVAITTISLWEAFFAPWRKIGETCSETFQKLIGGRGDNAVTQVATAATKAQASAVGTAPAKPAIPASNASQMASVATLGISLSFLASAAAAIASAVTHAPLWKTGSVVLGIILVVSIPSVILAWFRLRNRDLAPILNASGWAVNRSIGLTPRLGRFFTQRASYLGRRFVRRPNARKQGV